MQSMPILGGWRYDVTEGLGARIGNSNAVLVGVVSYEEWCTVYVLYLVKHDVTGILACVSTHKPLRKIQKTILCKYAHTQEILTFAQIFP